MYLGIDIGTTRLKINILNDEGKLVIEDSEKISPYFGPNGEAEIDPFRWIDGIKNLLKKYDLKDVKAIGLSGQMHSLILIDEKGNPIRKAILWADSRGHEEVEYLEAKYSDIILKHCGSLPSNAFTLVKLLYLSKTEPQSIEKAYKFCLSKDFVGGWLTGNYDTDLTDASATLMLDVQKGEWFWDLIEELKIPKRIFPNIHKSLEVRGYLKKEVADVLNLKPDIPVVYGAGDQEAAAFGVQVIKPESVMFSISTGSQIVVPVQSMITDRRIHNFRHIEGFHIMGAVQNAGLAIEWAINTFGFKDADELTQLALKSPVGSNGVMFLPYITPERTPIMKKDTFSGIVNLRSGNNRNNAARSILEGVAFCVYDAWRCVQEILFLEEPEITMLGGVSKNPIVRDSLLNLMNAKIKFLSENLDPSSFGAAVMAGKIEGKFDKIEDIIEKMVVETANARQKNEYLEKYEHFLNVRKKLLNV